MILSSLLPFPSLSQGGIQLPIGIKIPSHVPLGVFFKTCYLYIIGYPCIQYQDYTVDRPIHFDQLDLSKAKGYKDTM